jgi:hypothetical protein
MAYQIPGWIFEADDVLYMLHAVRFWWDDTVSGVHIQKELISELNRFLYKR